MRSIFNDETDLLALLKIKEKPGKIMYGLNPKCQVTTATRLFI
jgi:hypothetical protein